MVILSFSIIETAHYTTFRESNSKLNAIYHHYLRHSSWLEFVELQNFRQQRLFRAKRRVLSISVLFVDIFMNFNESASSCCLYIMNVRCLCQKSLKRCALCL